MKLKKQIIELYKQGLSTRKVAARVGLGKTTVNRILKNNGVIRDRYTCQNKNINEKYFDNINTEDKAYFLGLLFADGCVSRSSQKSWKINLGLKHPDEYLIEFFKRFCESEHKICHSQEKDFYSITISNKYMGESLIGHGVIPNKSLCCTFPNIHISLLNHFIRGYFDGDGSVNIGTKKYKSKSKAFLRATILGSKSFINSVQKILSSINIKSSVYKDGNIYVIHMSYSNADKFMNFIYKDSTIFMKRKRKKWELFNETFVS